MLSRLKNEMASRNITKYRLAKMTGINSPDIYNLFQGVRPLYPGWRRRIAAALQVPEKELFPKAFGEEEKKGE